MIKMTKIAATIAALTIVTPAAMAQDSAWYADGGIAAISADDLNIIGLQGHLGYQFHENFGAEAEAVFGITEETDQGVDTGINHNIGIFGVASFDATEALELFARLGFTTGEVEASANGISVGLDTDGPAYGIGGKYFFNEESGVRFEYTRYDLEATVLGTNVEAEIDSFSVSYAHKF